jgi:penicillin amidase
LSGRGKNGNLKGDETRNGNRQRTGADDEATRRLLRDLDLTKPAAAQAAHRLLQWNDVLDRDSPEAAIYEMWQRQMLADIRTVFVPKEARDYIGNPEMSKVIAWLTAPDGRFGADPVAGRNAFLEKTLESALDRLTLLLGSDIDKWKLGGFHRATILHPLSSALKSELREIFDVGKLGRGGDTYTVTATGGGDNQTSGGSFKKDAGRARQTHQGVPLQARPPLPKRS